MNHRERVLTAVNHQQPDQVPVAIWGSAYGITDPLYFGLLELLQLGEPVAPFRKRKGHSINYYDDRVLEALDIDVRHVDCGFTDLGGPGVGIGRDAWGIRYEKHGIYYSAVEHPLVNTGLTDLETYSWPQVERLVRLDETEQRARFLKEETDFAVVGRAADSYGPLERCCGLRSTQQFLIDLVEDPPFAAHLVGRVTDTLCRLLEVYLEAAGEYLDILELPGDDYASARPIISGRMFDRYFAPAWRRLIEVVKQKAPRVKIMFHSDGNMEPFLSRLIELGVDIFHCLEPLPEVDMAQIKQTYGEKLCFWGAVDIKTELQGDRARVHAEARRRIGLLGHGGGYVLAPSNHLQPDVPPGNVVALFEAAREYGRYPLSF